MLAPRTAARRGWSYLVDPPSTFRATGRRSPPAAPVAEPAALTWDPKPIAVWAEPDAASVASPADATR